MNPSSLPYILTFGRVVLAGAFAACVAGACRVGGAAGVPTGWLVALLALSVAAELTDLLDGVAARRAGNASLLGGLLDPLCDSLARLAMYFAVALAGWITLAVPLVMVVRDLVVAYVRTVVAHAGGATSARLSGKLKAVVQGTGLVAVVVVVMAAGPDGAAGARRAIAAVVMAVTIWSMIDYVRGGWPAAMLLYRRRAGG